MNLKMKQIRVGLGLGQQEVADQAGMPIRRYGSYERGERSISLEDAAKIADVLDCTLDELVGRRVSKSTSSLTVRERNLVATYRNTDERGRDAIDAVARSQSGVEEISDVEESSGTVA